jgi:NAD(P)H-flavin reductase
MFVPQPAGIEKIIQENPQIKTFVLRFTDEEYNRAFSYEPGQFMMVSVPHCGEAPISFASTPTRPGTIELSVRLAGKLTGAMHKLRPGDVVGLRGPCGKPFAMPELAGRNLLFVAGGIGLAPLRGVINYCLDKGGYGKIILLYGSRSPDDIAFKADIDCWRQNGVDCRLIIDNPAAGWDGPVGVVTTLLEGLKVAEPKSALVCGPPVMIRFCLARLTEMGFSDREIITTLERQMKCGIGVCGHCHLDNKLVCVDGPVFDLARLKKLDVAELGG